MDRIATKLWIVEDGGMSFTLGNYTDFQRQLGRRTAAQDEPAAPEPATAAAPPVEPAANVTISAKGKPRKRSDADVQKRLAQVERSISQLEGRLNEISDALTVATIDQDVTAIARLGEEFEKVQSELDAAYANWESISHSADMVAATND
jgi:ATP-binding cassette, subfamily F, member 3